MMGWWLTEVQVTCGCVHGRQGGMGVGGAIWVRVCDVVCYCCWLLTSAW